MALDSILNAHATQPEQPESGTPGDCPKCRNRAWWKDRYQRKWHCAHCEPAPTSTVIAETFDPDGPQEIARADAIEWTDQAGNKHLAYRDWIDQHGCGEPKPVRMITHTAGKEEYLAAVRNGAIRGRVAG